jgi:RNA polymerase sigma-70 factor (ECF subfamily)
MEKKVDDSDLVLLIAEGDRAAFKLLYTRYLNNLYRYAFLICNNKETSEEIVQELFVKVWEKRANLTRVNSIKAYLYRCTKNMLLDYVRKQQMESRIYDLLQQSTPSSATDCDSRVIYSQYYSLIREAIQQLPKKRRQIVEMRTYDELSLDEIAANLSISKSVVKKQLYQGISFVRSYLHHEAELIILIAVLFKAS